MKGTTRLDQRRKQRIKSIGSLKRFEDKRLDTTAQRQIGLTQQMNAIDAKIDHLEEELALQLETTSIELAPYLTTYVRAARSEIQRLKIEKSQAAREVSANKQALIGIFKRVRALEIAEERNIQRTKAAVDSAEAANALDDLLRRHARQF